MKKLLVLISTLFFLVACSDPGTNVAGESGKVKVIRAGTAANQGHSSHLGLEKFKEIVEEKSDGSIKVEVYHSGSLGDDRAMTEAVQLGTQELVIASDANAAPFFPELNVLGFPFLFPDNETAHEVLDGEFGQKILAKFEEKDVIGLGYWENGFRNITNSRKPIEKLEDLKGFKIRTMQNNVHIDVFSKLGATPTPMAFTELYTGLQQGTVDGQENPYPLIDQQKYYEIQDYLTESRHVYSSYVAMISKRFMENLTEEQQQIVREAAKEANKYQREVNAEQDKTSLENLKANGMQYNILPEEVRIEIQNVIQPVIDKYSKEIGEELVEEAYEAVKNASN